MILPRAISQRTTKLKHTFIKLFTNEWSWQREVNMNLHRIFFIITVLYMVIIRYNLVHRLRKLIEDLKRRLSNNLYHWFIWFIITYWSKEYIYWSICLIFCDRKTEWNHFYEAYHETHSRHINNQKHIRTFL